MQWKIVLQILLVNCYSELQNRALMINFENEIDTWETLRTNSKGKTKVKGNVTATLEKEETNDGSKCQE